MHDYIVLFCGTGLTIQGHKNIVYVSAKWTLKRVSLNNYFTHKCPTQSIETQIYN